MRASRPSGISECGTSHQRMVICLSIGSSRHRSLTVTRWSSPVWATISTSASGAASSAASTPPGRGASTWVISSARTAIRSRPSLRSRAMARSRRAGVKLPPSGKITNASLASRPVASAAICDSRSSPAAGLGEMNFAGIRRRITSIAGSQARVFLRTTRGSR